MAFCGHWVNEGEGARRRCISEALHRQNKEGLSLSGAFAGRRWSQKFHGCLGNRRV